MLITRKSPFSGVVRTRDIPITEEQLKRWERGEPIQRAMPEVSIDDREFIISGITAEEWAAEFEDTED